MKRTAVLLALLVSGLATGSALAQTTPATPAAPAAPQTAPAQTTPAQTPAAPAQTQPAPPADPNTVVARVGREDITLGDFERQYRIYVGRLVNAQGVPFTDDVLPYFSEYRPEILGQVARARGILQLARNANVKVDPAKVDEAIAGNRKEFDSDEAFVAALGQSGFGDEATFRQTVADSLLTNAYVDNLRGKFNFSDTVVQGYYNAHKADFTREARACVKHILVKDAAAAADVKTRLGKGEEFAKVAQDVSLDPGSKEQGGELGCFGPGVTVPEFDRASFGGPLNELQQVTTQFGVHLLQVSRRTEAGLAPLTEVEADIRRSLGNDAVQKYLTSQLARLKTETFADRVAAVKK